MLLSVCSIFSQFQPGVAYKSVACKNKSEIQELIVTETKKNANREYLFIKLSFKEDPFSCKT